MNIVFSSDENYAPLMGVAICSIFENKKNNYSIDIYVLDGGISQKNINKLKILEKKYNFKINYIKINTLFFKDFYTTNFFTQATYYRIMIPRLLSNLKKVLYLDCDIVVVDDIYELFCIDINNYLFAAAEDVAMNVYKKRHTELNIPIKETYYNAGVLLINIEKCKNDNAPETIIKFIKDNPEKLENVDQDALNATMWNNFLCIEQKYNYFPFLLKYPDLYKFEIKKDIKIIHYAGKKPWEYLNNNKLATEYFYYLKKTPWKKSKYINLYRGGKHIFLISLSSYFEKKISTILSKENVEKIRKLKRKLGIKFY